MSTFALASAEQSTSPRRFNDIWRIVRLHAVNPSVFFGTPWLIMGGALLVSMAVAVMLHAALGPNKELDGFRYSWAVLSPQWYLVVVGVQAIGLTCSFALGFGSTRRDFWLGTCLMFVLVSLEMAIGIATLVQIEKLTNGWWIGAGMFDALWYGQRGWFFDFYTTFVMQLFVLIVGASITTVYLRWRMRGTTIVLFGTLALLLAIGALITLTGSWAAVAQWVASIGLWGIFTVLLGISVLCGIGGYLVIRRATPR